MELTAFELLSALFILVLAAVFGLARNFSARMKVKLATSQTR